MSLTDGGPVYSRTLESQLEIIFKIAKHFNAVLLLDEAFMASHTELHDSHKRLVNNSQDNSLSVKLSLASPKSELPQIPSSQSVALYSGHTPGSFSPTVNSE